MMASEGKTTSLHPSLSVMKSFPGGPQKVLLASSLIKTGSHAHSAAGKFSGISGYHMHTFNQSRGSLGQTLGSVSCLLPQLSAFTQHGPWSVHSGDTANDKLRNKAPERQQRPVLPQPHASRFPGVGSDFVIETSSDRELGLIFLPLIQKITGDAEPEVFLHLPYIGRQPPSELAQDTPDTKFSLQKRLLTPEGQQGRWGEGEGAKPDSKQHEQQTRNQASSSKCVFLLFVCFAEVVLKEIGAVCTTRVSW